MSSIAFSHRRHLVLAIVVALLAALSGAVTSPAPAANSAPVSIEIDRITSGLTAPSGLPDGAEPYVLVKAGGTIFIEVSFFDAEGLPASFTKDTRLTVSTSVGTLTTSEGVAPRGATSATIRTSLQGPVNRVALTVSAGSGRRAPTPGTSHTTDKDLRFDVLTDVSPLLDGTNGFAFQAGFGGNSDCAEATESAPVCQILVLPRGAGTDVLLSVGACDTDTTSTYAPCYTGAGGTVGGAVTQALFAHPSDPYTTTAPATVIVKCDKTLCGGGAIRNVTVIWSRTGDGDLVKASPCPAKGTMAKAGEPCVDYVQSKRDGSGDTHLFLLTDGDIRTGIG